MAERVGRSHQSQAALDFIPPNHAVVLATPTRMGLIGTSGAWFLGSCGGCPTGSPSLVKTTSSSTFSGTTLTTSKAIYSSPVDVTFSSPRDAWAVLREYPALKPGVASAERIVLLTSQDGGVTWHVRNSRVRPDRQRPQS